MFTKLSKRRGDVNQVLTNQMQLVKRQVRVFQTDADRHRAVHRTMTAQAGQHGSSSQQAWPPALSNSIMSGPSMELDQLMDDLAKLATRKDHPQATTSRPTAPSAPARAELAELKAFTLKRLITCDNCQQHCTSCLHSEAGVFCSGECMWSCAFGGVACCDDSQLTAPTPK